MVQKAKNLRQQRRLEQEKVDAEIAQAYLESIESLVARVDLSLRKLVKKAIAKGNKLSDDRRQEILAHVIESCASFTDTIQSKSDAGPRFKFSKER